MRRISWIAKSLWGAGFGAGALLCAQSASAQSIALNSQSQVLRYAPGHASPPRHDAQPTWISHDDCEKNVFLEVPLVLTPPFNAPMQVWAGGSGADCTVNTNRAGTTQVCWEVTPQQTASTNVNIDINAQDLIYPITLGTGQKPPSYTAGTPAACDSFTQSGAVQISIYFMFLDSSGALLGTDATYAASISLLGPPAPSNVGVGVGDTLLKATWTPAVDANTRGFDVFCDPPPGKEGTVDNSDAAAANELDSSTVLVCDSTTEDGGFDDAGNYLGDIVDDAGCRYENQSGSSSSTSNGCFSTEITPGGGTTSSSGSDEAGTTTSVVTGAKAPPGDIGNYLCGSGGQTSTEADITGLKNGQTYVVGVAAIDQVGNVGPISGVACDSPTPVDDFWKDYKNAGGGAGGGFCSVDKSEPAGGLGAFVLVGLASAAAITKRRITKKRSLRK